MFKELSMAIFLTLLFSVGVGVLFIRTVIEMIELFFNGDSANHLSVRNKHNK